MFWLYAVAMLPTALNEEELGAQQASGPTQAIFDDPVRASKFAVDKGWWPFIVERIPDMTKDQVRRDAPQDTRD